MRKKIKRTYCEDISPTIKSIRSCKNHNQIKIINNNVYHQIGDDMLYCTKTSRIFKLESIQ